MHVFSIYEMVKVFGFSCYAIQGVYFQEFCYLSRASTWLQVVQKMARQYLANNWENTQVF